jgi:hypothetical protein
MGYVMLILAYAKMPDFFENNVPGGYETDIISYMRYDEITSRSTELTF